MKVIKPLGNMGSITTSDAPNDALSTWAPTGRDLLNYVPEPVFDIVGDSMVIASSSQAGKVYSVDLATGVVSETGYTAPYPVLGIDVSPDGAYAYINLKSAASGSVGVIITAATGAVNYTSVEEIYSGGIVRDRYYNSVWESDSSEVHFAMGKHIRTVVAATGSESTITLTNNSSGDFSTLAMVGTDFFACSDPNSASVTIMKKMSATGSELASSFTEASIFSLEYNSSTSELIALTSSVGIASINQTTLALADLQVGGSGFQFYTGARSFKTTATHLIARSLSTSPYWNYYLLADYSLDKSLPALTNTGKEIAVGTNYTAVSQNDGIALIDNLTDLPVGQINPNVIAGDKYIYGDKTYEVLIDNDDTPTDGVIANPATWLDTGAINRLRMFDGKLDSVTTGGEELNIAITPNAQVTGLAMFNVSASTIEITMTDPVDGIVYESGVISMIDNSAVTDWYSYYFAPYIVKYDFATVDLPSYPDAVIDIKVSAIDSNVQVGEIVVGRVSTLGITQFGTSVGILDFSKKEQDQFGNFNIIKRKFSKRADYDVKMSTNNVSGSQRFLSSNRSTPMVWIGDVNREETIIYGYYKSFDIVLSNPALSDTAITVEGL